MHCVSFLWELLKSQHSATNWDLKGRRSLRNFESTEWTIASSPGRNDEVAACEGVASEQRETRSPEPRVSPKKRPEPRAQRVGGSLPRRLVSAKLQRRRKGVSPETGNRCFTISRGSLPPLPIGRGSGHFLFLTQSSALQTALQIPILSRYADFLEVPINLSRSGNWRKNARRIKKAQPAARKSGQQVCE